VYVYNNFNERLSFGLELFVGLLLHALIPQVSVPLKVSKGIPV
jgi:hypothetical protein